MNLGTPTGCYKFSFEDKFKILGCALNRHGKTYDAVEERMQSANKAFWKGIFANKMFHGRLSVKGWWTTSTQSLRLGVKTGRGPIQTMEKIKGWETKTMMRLFRFKRKKDETWVKFHARTCIMARNICIQMGLPFLHEKFAESMWRAMHGMGV